MLRAVGWIGISGAVVTYVEMGRNSSGPSVLTGAVVGRLSLAIYLLLVALW